MTEIIEPGVLEILEPKRKITIRPTDVVIIVAILAALAGAAFAITSFARTKHDIASGKAVADQVVADIAKRDGTSARKLGNTTFQSTYTAAQLTTQFKAIEPVTSHARSVDRQTLSRGAKSKTMFVIYKYPTKDLAFYVRVSVEQHTKTHTWQLTNIAGSADVSSLVIN